MLAALFSPWLGGDGRKKVMGGVYSPLFELMNANVR